MSLAYWRMGLSPSLRSALVIIERMEFQHRPPVESRVLVNEISSRLPRWARRWCSLLHTRVPQPPMPSGAGLTPNVLAWHLTADRHNPPVCPVSRHHGGSVKSYNITISRTKVIRRMKHVIHRNCRYVRGREGFLGIPNHSFCLLAILNNSTVIEMNEDKFLISHCF